MDFAVHAARLSAEADNRLGDLILYADGAGAFREIKGRLFAVEPDIGVGGRSGFSTMDEQQGGWRLRVAKAVVPNPTSVDRLKCVAILGDQQYRPMSKNPIDDGRYWLVDIQAT